MKVQFPRPEPRPKYPADKVRTYADTEREAGRTRRLLGFDPEQPLPSTTLFERLEVLKTGTRLNIPVSYRVRMLRPGVEAETRFDPDSGVIEVILTEETYSELENGGVRARFSLAHEIGHAVQHCAEVVRLSSVPHETAALMRGNYVNLRPFEDCEWQADAFAGGLLVPALALWKIELAGKLTADDIARRFHVSRPSAAKRLQVYQQRKEQLVC